MSVHNDKRWVFDQTYRQQYPIIAGSDEAGRGAWAGPIVVASVILPPDFQSTLIKDSKKMSIVQRQIQFEVIKKIALDYAIVIIDERLVEKLNPKQASIQGMQSTLVALKIKPDLALIDGEHLVVGSIKTEKLIKGDDLSLSIAAASVLAKVTRDQIMYYYDQLYPGYNFLHNVGYGTADHLLGLKKAGLTPLHRRTYKPVQKFLTPWVK